ncbi:MAG: AraC family transcriptional regulator [Planctomycetota bacterium]
MRDDRPPRFDEAGDSTPFAALLKNLYEPFSCETIFDLQPDIVYFIKDAAGRYVVVNRTFVQRLHVDSKKDVIGRTAVDMFPAPLGASYLEQDLRLVADREPLLNELELQPYPDGGNGWCITTKIPLWGKGRPCVGLVGTSRDLHMPAEDHGDVTEAVRWAQDRLSEPLTLERIAGRTSLSPYQFDKRIRAVFHLSMTQLLLKFRMDLATEMLRQTDMPILGVALECGYGDQSSFTRQFKKTTGLTPGEYRRSSRNR